MAATLAAGAAATPGWAGDPGSGGESPWSAPAGLSSCPADGAPRVVFPGEGPELSTGPGALVWSAAPGCSLGSGAELDAISPSGSPAVPRAPRSARGLPLRPSGPIGAAPAPKGEIAIAGSEPGRPSGGLLIEGHADGPFAAFGQDGGTAPPAVLSTAYLGDLGILAPLRGAHAGGLLVEVERHHSTVATRRASVAGPATAEALALDYRSDALAVWERHDGIYACYLPASGHHACRSQQLGPAGQDPHVAALLSDDVRGIVMWVDTSGTMNRVYLDYSAPGVRFGPPELLELFASPDGLPSPAGSPQLIRLSSESVMAAWAGAAAGHWALRVAPIDQRGLRTISTITAAGGGDALLSALAPGPGGEAILLWSEPATSPDGAPDMARQSLFAARGSEGAPGSARFGPAELVAAPGPVAGASVGIDPGTGLALAAWLGEHGSVRWSIRSPAGGD